MTYDTAGGRDDGDNLTTDSSATASMLHNMDGVAPDPPSHITFDTVDLDVSRELLKLSLNDRNAMEEEIHGVRCLAVEETPEIVARGLRDFDAELAVAVAAERSKNSSRSSAESSNGVRALRNIVTGGGAAPRSGGRTAPTSPYCYVNDPKVRLRFLRFEYFVVEKAVQRFVLFLKFCHELFGDCIADHPPRIQDFIQTEQEKSALINARNQFLEIRDRSGRRVSIGVGHCDFVLDHYLRCKIIMYLFWVVSEDTETQQKGVVLIAWPDNNDREQENGSGAENAAAAEDSSGGGFIRSKLTRRTIRHGRLLFHAIPARVVAIHFCAIKPVYKVLNIFYYFALRAQPGELPQRYRAHFGDPIEIRYKLQGYGIPVDLLPLTHNGTVKTTTHSRWMSFRISYELKQRQDGLRKLWQQQQLLGNNSMTLIGNSVHSSSSNVDEEYKVYVECPRSVDVIFRKGKYCAFNHPGNFYYYDLIEEYHEQHFNTSSRTVKTELTWNIVNRICGGGGEHCGGCEGGQEGDANNQARAAAGCGGRFLDWDSKKHVWIELTDPKQKRDKVAASFKSFKNSTRNRRRASGTRNKQQQQQLKEENDDAAATAAAAKRRKTAMSSLFSACGDNADRNRLGDGVASFSNL